MKKILCAALALIILCLCLTSCGDDEATVLFAPVDTAAGVLDPQTASDATAMLVVRNCFEGLVRLDENGIPVPGVAESWKVSEDGLKYVFKLRTDAVWHLTSNAKDALGDKLPENFDLSVTAADFEFALKRAVTRETASPEGYMLANIKNAAAALSGGSADKLGVKAADRYTLEVTLSAPQQNFLEILAEPMCMPCSETFFRACCGRYGRYIKYLLSNGPFYLSRLYEDSYRINANPDYHGSYAVNSDAVWLYLNSDRADVMNKLKDGDYSCAFLEQHEYEDFSPSEKMTVTAIPNVLRSFLMNLSDPVLSNENIRKAISFATDRDFAVASAGMTPAAGIVPAAAAGDVAQTHPDTYDEAAAQKYFTKGLAELGVDDISVEILCEDEYGNMVKQLIQKWQKTLGVSFGVSLVTCDENELYKAVASGRYSIALSAVTAQSGSPYFYFSSFAEGSPYSGIDYRSPSVPGYLKRLCSGTETENGIVYRSIEELLLKASFCIPLWNENTYFVTNASAGNVFSVVGRDKVFFR